VEAGRFPPSAAPEWLVVSAWPPELDGFRKMQPPKGLSAMASVALGSIGIGLVEGATGATRLLAGLRPRAVILIGTAGLYPTSSDRFAVGTAAVADDIVMVPRILPGRDAYLPELIPSRERATAGLAKAIRKLSGLPAAHIANPLAITASRRAAAFIARQSGCDLENLEAFALARAAASLEIPFAVVLGIANRVGPGAHHEWKKNGAAAAAKACEAVLAFLR